MNKKKKILLCGGGTAGSVTPLLAIYASLVESDFDFCWVGTRNGVEKSILNKENFKYYGIFSGKFRRYFSWKNLLDPFFIFYGFLQSFFVLIKEKPSVVIGAGSFVCVPVSWAAFFLRIPVIAHQQDLVPGLANKIIAPIAKIITTTFEKSLGDFGKKAVWTGNPVRKNIKSSKTREIIFSKYSLKNSSKTILFIGGGTGANKINNFIWNNLEKLAQEYQVIHITGKGKGNKNIKDSNYRQFEFLAIEDLADVYKISDLVISRAGLGSLTELSFLEKPSILIPIKNSHQEVNADIFKENEAAFVLDEDSLAYEALKTLIEKIFLNDVENLSKNMSRVMKDGADEKYKKLIKNLKK